MIIRLALSVTATIVLSSVALSSAARAEGAKEGTRLEELFIWKSSEELRLPPEQEQKFSETVRDLNARRRKANEAMNQAIEDLAGAKSPADAEKLTARYRVQLREIHTIQIAELDQLKKILGPEKLARFLVVKNSIMDKLKTLISAPTPSPKK